MQGGQAGTLPLNRLSQCQRLFQKLPGKSRFSLRHQGRRDRSLKRDGGEIRTRTVKHPARLRFQLQHIMEMIKLAPCRHKLRQQCATQIGVRSEENTSVLQSLMRISYAVLCLKKKTQ